jgi:hypothetical protein
MTSPSFAHVPEEGFQSFTHELSQGAWALIDTSSYEGPNHTATKSLYDAPIHIGWKLQIAWILGKLADVRSGADGAAEADRNWDGTQKRCAALLSAAANELDPEKRAAAARLQKVLLLGAGAKQTKLKYQQEVDFGRTQLLLAKETQHAADIVTLGLTGLMADIALTTDTLAEAIGHGQGLAHRPSERRRAAVVACSATFAAVEGSIAWVLDKGLATDRTKAQALVETLHALAARYAAPETHAAAPGPAVPPAAPPTP